MKKKIFEILRKTLAFFRGEYCIVFRKNEYGIEITEGFIKEEKKELRIFNKVFGTRIDEFKKPFLKADRLICGLGSDLATTLRETVDVARKDEKEEISEKELEHLIFQGLWNFLNNNRLWISEKMKTKETDLVLAHMEVISMELDGHSVIHPAGFSGKTLSICFQGTFISRETMKLVSSLHSWSQKVLVCEEGAALAHFVSENEKNEIAAFCHEESTAIFFAGENKLFYLDEISLGMKHLSSFVQEKFGVSGETAEKLIVYYAQHGVSKHLERLFKEQFNSFVSDLFSEIEGALSKNKKVKSEKGKMIIHLNFNYAVSESRRILNKTVKGTMNVLEKKLGHSGFSIFPEEEKSNISTAGLFVYPFTQHTLAFANQLLHRRAKWLITNISQ